MLNGLDLFSGIGGLSAALAPWVRTAAYCENDRYAQGVLLSRMAQGQLRTAPIWDDICTLSSDWFADLDIIFGGFPCQDISAAGIGLGLEGKRSGLVFEVLRLIGKIRPTFVFLENVAAIRTRGADVVCSRLASLGYDCRWTMLAASDVGAPHRRERWWLLAADADRQSGRLQPIAKPWCETTPVLSNYGVERTLANADGQRLEGSGRRSEQSRSAYGSWWSSEPTVGRVANGIPHRVDRIKGLGNAVVPAQAREAFESLMGLVGEER